MRIIKKTCSKVKRKDKIIDKLKDQALYEKNIMSKNIPIKIAITTLSTTKQMFQDQFV